MQETQLACSGRDELCRSVLNDVWVSHPTWASEEAGFLSHKKNSYEEALHKSEEERHEFQFYIDIITRTISLLQPLFDRLNDTGPNAMSAEEKLAFKLPPDFGGPSKSIYHRAIKKVYGRDSAGMEVLQALQESPAIAIPVVLPRLKQKNEEWRKAQREWNRVWREVDARNFYKSLDHQGITFKANDKKNITMKSFVAEIESAKEKQLETLAQLISTIANGKKSTKASTTSTTMPVSSAHLEYSFTDFAVLQDAMKLVFSFLDRSSVGYSAHERRTVERMLRAFVPLLCMFPQNVAAEFDAAFGPPLENDADGEGNETDAFGGDPHGHMSGNDDSTTNDDMDDTLHVAPKRSGRRSAGGHASAGGGIGGVSAGDLRKKLLKTAQEKAARAKASVSASVRSASASRAPSPTVSDDGHTHGASSATSTTSTPGGGSGDKPKKRKGPKRKDAHGSHSQGNQSAEEGAGNARKGEQQRETEHSSESDEWVKLMPMIGSKTTVYAGTGVVNGVVNGKKTDEVGAEEPVVDPVSALGKHGVINQHPFFMNTTFYTLIRLLQVRLCAFLILIFTV